MLVYQFSLADAVHVEHIARPFVEELCRAIIVDALEPVISQTRQQTSSTLNIKSKDKGSIWRGFGFLMMPLSSAVVPTTEGMLWSSLM
ncbi:hypothetical protein [Yoonia sp.]|uniref:hypothetical protein n=1 Tax=Yoonia sp. TaxID=2212373 RepID=UPI003A4DAF0E